MTTDEAYVVLGIENRDLDLEELKRIFREAARLSHPDSNPENAHAMAKFAMIQEAYRLLQTQMRREKANEVRKAKDACEKYESNFSKIYREYNANSAKRYETNEPKQSSRNSKTRDRWDYYAEADRRFAEQRRAEANRKAKEAMFRQHEKEAQNKEVQNREAQNKEQSKTQYKSQNDSNLSDTEIHMDAGLGAGAAAVKFPFSATLIEQVTVTVSNAIRMAWDYFMAHDLLFDGLMMFLIAASAICCNITDLSAVIAGVLIWGMGLLISRRITKWCFPILNSNIIRLLVFLAVLEVQVELYKILIF